MLKKLFILYFLLVFLPVVSKGQSFYKERQPKKIGVMAGLGAGYYLAAPGPYTDSLVNQVMPIISLGISKKMGNHFSLKSIFSFQTFAIKNYVSREFLVSDTEQKILNPLFRGISYAFELTPTFNLMPSNHHLDQSMVDVGLGVGIGYLATMTTEKFSFQDREFNFNFLRQSPYVPVRSSVIFRLDSWSDLAVEGVFFYTWLNDGNSIRAFSIYGDHFAQLNLVYRRFIR